MANIKFSRKVFEKEIGKLTDEMQNKIALFGTTLEGFDDEEIELEIFPDRPDLLSYYGFKRSFLSFLGKKTGLKKYNLNKPEEDHLVKIDSSVKEVRPNTVCAIIKGLKLDDEKIKDIINIQEKLHLTVGRKRKKVAIGIYPLDKIRLPITYKAVEPDKIKFKPLESPREMTGLEILQKHQTGKEYAHLLSGKVKFPIFIDAEDNILSMPPIINSELMGRVEESTKDVFVECSGFDLNILEKCLNILVTSLNEMGGKIYQMKVGNELFPKLKTEKRKISLTNINKILGLELKEKEMKNLFLKMGYNYEKEFVEIPSWRVDILHEIDLIEDIAIAYGYDNFVPELPKISTIGKIDSKELIKMKLSEILIGSGLLEVSNYHLTKETDQFLKMGYNEKKIVGEIKLEGSKTDYTILRNDLSHYLLKNISMNSHSEYPQNIFEIGRVFEKVEEQIIEKDKLACLFAPGNFTDIKQNLDFLLKNIGLDLEIKELNEFPKHFIDGRIGGIYLENELIGFMGEIHPKILKNFKIKVPISLFEINLEKIFKKFL